MTIRACHKREVKSGNKYKHARLPGQLKKDIHFIIDDCSFSLRNTTFTYMLYGGFAVLPLHCQEKENMTHLQEIDPHEPPQFGVLMRI